MSPKGDKTWLDDALIAAYGSAPQPQLDPWPPRPDFDRWLSRYPEAVAGLRSGTERGQRPAAARSVPLRLGAWLLGSPVRVAATAAGLLALAAFGAWLADRGTPPVEVAETPAPRELPQPAPEPPAGLDQRACSPAAKAKQEREDSGSAAGVAWMESPHPSGPPDRRAAALPLRAKADAVQRIPWSPIDTTPLLAGGRTGNPFAGRVPLSIWLAEASAVVRARMVRITEDAIVCEAVRVIYGRVPGKTLHSAGLPDTPSVRELLRHEHGRDPIAAEIRTAVSQVGGFEAGREVIITLGSGRKTEEAVVAPFLRVFPDVPGWRSLDQLEKQMVDILAAGVHMMPRCIPEAMGFYIPSCERIVRGRVAKVDDRTAQWEVVSVISVGSHVPGGFVAPPPKTPDPRYIGPPASEVPGAKAPRPIERSTGGISAADSKRLTIALDPWWLRAEAEAAYRAAQDSGQPATEAAVRKEFARLIEAELPVGREAILLVRTLPGPPGEPVRYKLVAIVFASAEKGESIEQLQEDMLQMIAKGEHMNQNF